MSLESGGTLSHYRLIEQIGEGGMGVVWKTLDTTLDREVAIKILPGEMAENPERLARFEREARLLASLNHPNIATIYGLDEDSGQRFIAMELVPGEDLEQRLGRGPLPMDQALTLIRQVAGALEAAHANGVVHRDLKPSNVRVTPDGTVKVLDFGLAKSIEGRRVGEGTDPASSPTLTSALSAPGVIVGSAAYMSPEQARGNPVDPRTDLWALGCLLYECLTAKRVFVGDSVSDTLAAVLRADPDWSALPGETPASVRRLLRRCLTKEPQRRLHSAADARIEIEDAAAEGPVPTSAAEHGGKERRPWLPWSLAALLAVAAVALGVAWQRARSVSPGRLHVAVTLPQELELMPAVNGDLVAALSPDGTRVAFTAREEDTIRLYLRSLDSPDVVVVPGTEEASSPFFSPDGRWVAFFANAKLMKVSVSGGAPVEICGAPSGRGGSWSTDGTIVFSPMYTSGLSRVPAAGGEPEMVTRPDHERNERTHRWPDVLPGARAALCTVGTLEKPGYYEDATIAVADLGTGALRPLIEGGSFARYSPTGHLIYSREGVLFAVPFDLARLEVTGPPARLPGRIARQAMSGGVNFTVSAEGTLIYLPEEARSMETSLVWVDRKGRAETIGRTPVPFLAPRLSPDGSRLVVGVGPGVGDGDVWIHDLEGEQPRRLTFDSDYVSPLWSPDGERVVFGVTRGGDEGIAWKAADGSGAEETILGVSREYVAQPADWHADGKTLLFTRIGGPSGYDLMTIGLGETEPHVLIDEPAREGGGSFSPGGRWFAYTSNESGRYEVYVRSYPDPASKWQLSTEGGKGPVWSRDGREIFYTHGNRMMVVPVETEPTFSPGRPRLLFRFEFLRDSGLWPDYDVSADGQRFVMYQRSPEDPPPRRINVVTELAGLLE